MRTIGLLGVTAAVALPALLLAACAVTEVKLTPQGEAVRIAATADEAKGCTGMGRVLGSSTNRSQDERLQREMNARNQAAELGATLLVRVHVESGESSAGATAMTTSETPVSFALSVDADQFEAYRCPK
jgi:Domain of unknown function (DUF4156)